MDQTLHLIVDPELFAEEMEPDGIVEKSDHRDIKTDVIKKAFDILPEGGHFILIDEWPPLFSNTSTDPLEAIVNPLFDQIFRPILHRTILQDIMMKKVPNARFVAEMKARINREHSMYIFIYAKDPDKKDQDGSEPSVLLPNDEEEAASTGITLREADMARSKAVERIYCAFRAMDKPFIEGYAPINGERQIWAEFIPIGKGEIFDSRGFDNNELADALQSRRYDSVILSRVLHNVSNEERRRIMRNAVESLNPGGSLMLIDEWPSPSDCSNSIHKRDLRDTVVAEFERKVIFEASLREKIRDGFDCGMYGYLFRKIR